jgi:hypothetical protein
MPLMMMMMMMMRVLWHVMYTYQASFHTIGHTNTHNHYFWGKEQPYEIYQHVQDSPKVNVWCGIMHDCVLGTLFVAACIITANVYLDMIQWFVLAQSDGNEQGDKGKMLFQQGGAPHHFNQRYERL